MMDDGRLGTLLTNPPEMMARVQTPTRRVAVIICCYSGRPFFVSTLESVIEQTFTGIDVIIHDNGCHPEYSRLIDDLAFRYGAVVFRSTVNRYGEGLRADVLPFIRHEYVFLVHDDDVYLPHKVATAVAEMDDKRLDFLFTDRTYIDERGAPLAKEYDAVNTDPIVPEDYPHRYLAEMFYKGLRLHFSTISLRGPLARKTLLGDPYLPRIADAAFFSQMLLQPSLRGSVSGRKDTCVRVHGSNDFLYEKFAGKKRERELVQLGLSEFLTFQDIVRSSDDLLLGRILTIFPGIPEIDSDDRLTLLTRAGLYLRPWRDGKKLMGAYCLHEAFKIDGERMMALVRELTGSDANREMKWIYDTYMDDVVGHLD